MRQGWLALACLVCALALTGTATADLRVGVNDDAGKFEEGASWFYPTMAATGLGLNAITLRWDENAPTAIADEPRIAEAIARANASGVAVVLDVYPLRSQALTNGARCTPSPNPEACGNTARIAQFAAWAAAVALTSLPWSPLLPDESVCTPASLRLTGRPPPLCWPIVRCGVPANAA